MSNTPAHTAETKTSEYRSTGTERIRYETDYRFAKRDFGGWTIHLTNPNASRTIETDSCIDDGLDTTSGQIGWVTKDHENGGWTLWHALAGETKAEQWGTGWRTRDEAAEELVFLLLTRRIVSPASTDRFRYLGRDFIDHNELTLTASRVVEQFSWEADYERLVASLKEVN